MRRNIRTIGSILIYLILAFGLTFFIYYFEMFPAGEHVWKYLNKAEDLNRAWKAVGTTGMERIRLIYAAYVGIVYLISAVTWYVIGKKENRCVIGFFVGLLWFFMPVNLQMLFREGELLISLILSVLPLMIWLIHRCMTKRGKNAVLKMSAVYLFVIIIVCSVIVAAGQSLRGTNAYQKIVTSLNPVSAMSSDNPTWYFGIAVFFLLLLGAMFSHKKTMPLFWSGMILFLATSLLLSPLIGILPGLKEMKITLLFPVAACFVFVGFMLWDTLKKQLVCLVLILMTADAVAAVSGGMLKNIDFGMEETIQKVMDRTLLGEAFQLTQQKIAFFSGEREQTLIAYILSDGEKEISLHEEYMEQLEQALADGKYLYVFERCLEWGDDTIVIEKSRLSERTLDAETVTNAAEVLGYLLKEENKDYLLYHMDEVGGQFGVEREYEVIGIGTFSGEMALLYPALKETSDTNLNSYSYEELSKYKTVYLNGFTYDDKEAAEQMLVRLSENGTKIVIEADGIPADILSKNREFLGVTCNDVSFENGFPILYIQEDAVDLNLLAKGEENWKTVYLTGIDEELGYFYENQRKIYFMGTVQNSNIIFVGLNLDYHYALTGDPNVEEIYNELLGLEKNQLPEGKK